jgi:putative transposase
VRRAQDWRWSSVRAHRTGQDDHVVKVAPVLERGRDLSEFLPQRFDQEAAFDPLRRAETIGTPICSHEWVTQLEQRFHWILAPRPAVLALDG